MNTLAFWLPLFLFASALLGTILKRRAKDHCLKKFEGHYTILPSLSGEMIQGFLSVYAQGIQLLYPQKIKKDIGMIDSFVLHPAEIEKIPYLIRPAPDPETRAGFKWSQEMHRILQPNFLQKSQRLILTFYNMLKDAFGQAAKAIISALSKDTSISKVKDSNKRIEEVRSGLTELVPMHEAILEKYRGRRVIIERKGADGMVYESGVLEDYSSKYLLLREVHLKERALLEKIELINEKKNFGLDMLFSRKIAIIRHTVDDSSNLESTT